MFSWFLNPWMLLGGLAVASPILIHLLNKRRFKIVQWAAMDFLFEADKQNRRRVQIENFLLLMLRCLAMLLLALMLARPFLPSSLTAVLQQTQKVERVLLIDDSLSQRVLNGAQSSLQTSIESAKTLITQLANSTDSEDWLTVMRTSDTSQFLIDNQPLTPTTLTGHLQALQDIQCSEQAADYSEALQAMKTHLGGDQNYGRAAYIYSDLRKRDWLIGTQESVMIDQPTGAQANVEAAAPNKIVESFSDDLLGTFVIDTGGPNDDNLAITSIRADRLLVANKVINFVVEVANYGDTTVQDLKVLLQVGDAQPEYQTISSIAPAQTQELVFTWVFTATDADSALLNFDQSKGNTRDYRVVAQIDRQSLTGDGLEFDQLAQDSKRLMVASVIDGIPVLLVDGDPSASSERSETHYLRSLQVLGTGLRLKTATISDLETASLSDYEVIFLCNVDEVSAERVGAIKQWVSNGGALVLMPGNRVRAEVFNDTFCAESGELSPIKLTDIHGDSTMAKWVNFEVAPQIHPSLRVIIDSDASSLGNVDVFSWWTSELVGNIDAVNLEIPLRLTDADNSIAMIDRRIESGRVIAFTIPGDGDWTMWPSSPTFAPVMVDMISYLAGSQNAVNSIQLGSGIKLPVDLSAFVNRVTVRDPEGEKMETVAKPIDPDRPQSVLYQAEFEKFSKRGFYDIELKRHSGDVQNVLVSTNYDVRESALKRVSQTTLDKNFFGEKTMMVTTAGLLDQTVDGGNSELWMTILLMLMLILAAEQFLGWYWGRKR